MKTIFVINVKQYSYHKRILEFLAEAAKKYGEVQVFDMSENIPLHEQYYRLQEAGADFLVSFDCAGFELRTENNTLSYNHFGCRMAHLLFRHREEYREALRQQMNFSMFVFSAKEKDVLFLQKHLPNIPNAEWLEIPEGIKQTGQEGLADKESECFRWAEKWFSYIIKEAELNF